MSHRRKDNSPVNENWIKSDNLKQWKVSAKELLEKVKTLRSQYVEITVKDPTRTRCWICKLIKK